MVVGEIKFIILQFKMFKLESCIRGFHVYYVSRTPHEGELFSSLRLRNRNREDPYAVGVDILSKFRMKILESWVSTLFKLTQNLLSSVLLWSCFVTCTVR